MVMVMHAREGALGGPRGGEDRGPGRAGAGADPGG